MTAETTDTAAAAERIGGRVSARARVLNANGDGPHVYSPNLLHGGHQFKLWFDYIVGPVLLVLSLPAMALIAVAIKLDSPGPIIYRQVRPGLRGKRFVVYKFRTMTEGADALNGKNHHNGIHPKTRDDNRVTGVGRWLRRFSLDEMPQFFNILNGSMSLVGPRPLQLTEHPHPDEEEKLRLSVKPGMTGLWQVSGRSDLPADEMLSLDLQYVEAWSLRLELSILWRTLGAIIRPRGAY